MDEDSDLDNSANHSPGEFLQSPLRRTTLRVTEPERPSWRYVVNRVMNHWLFTTWMVLLTIYALLGDDLRLAVTSRPYDDGFFAMSSVCLFFFLLELILSSFVKDSYLLGFYFWLDALSTISLVSDIGWLWDLIIGSQGIGKQTAKTSQVLRAGRASRVGTRAARILRIIRVIRLIRIVRLYKLTKATGKDSSKVETTGSLQRSLVAYRGHNRSSFPMVMSHTPEVEVFEEDVYCESFNYEFTKDKEHRNSEDISNIATSLRLSHEGITSLDRSALGPSGDEEETELPEESQVGKRLSDQISKRTILLVLSIIVMAPFLSSSMYMDKDTSFKYGLKWLNHFIGGDPDTFEEAWQAYITDHSDIDKPIIYLEISDLRVWKGSVDYLDLRLEELSIVQYSGDLYDLTAVFNLRQQSQLQAATNIARTIFIALILAISTMCFAEDANSMVIGPIESMVQKVKRISRNPLEAAQLANREAFVLHHASNKRVDKNSLMETTALEKIIEKIGALLAIGFGEAGSEIIIANMKKSGGDVDPMIPGRKIECIFGFCDIRNFTDATEVLQGDVMMFANDIASIVHTTVYHFLGAPNKNIGDAFLLVWKLSANINSETMNLSLLSEKHICRQTADMAVMSFMKILAQIHKNPKVLKYRQHVGLNSRMPGYSVAMGFGLHAGWAIEGAIGSDFKIDASYLSPHVNLASRLEAATKQYGVPILVSGTIFELATSGTRAILRRIDRVTVKGSRAPVDMYTPDLRVDTLLPDPPEEPRLEDKTAMRLNMQEQRETLKKIIVKDKLSVTYLYQEDLDFQEMLKMPTSDFREKWKIGFEYYLHGEWTEAKRFFIEAEEAMGHRDGPCRTLLAVMAENGDMAPRDWPGYRELTEK